MARESQRGWAAEGFAVARGVPWIWRPAEEVQLGYICARCLAKEELQKGVPKVHEEERKHYRVQVRREDFLNHGFTQGCPGCQATLSGMPHQTHSEQCRRRMDLPWSGPYGCAPCLAWPEIQEQTKNCQRPLSELWYHRVAFGSPLFSPLPPSKWMWLGSSLACDSGPPSRVPLHTMHTETCAVQGKPMRAQVAVGWVTQYPNASSDLSQRRSQMCSSVWPSQVGTADRSKARSFVSRIKSLLPLI